MLIASIAGCGGSLAGALIGTIISVYDIPASLQVPGMLALAGAASGMFRKSKVAGPVLWLVVVTFFSGVSVLTENMVPIYYETLAAGILFMIIPNPVKLFLGNLLSGIEKNVQVQYSHEYGQIHEAADRLFVLGKALSRVSRNIEETILDDNAEISGTDWIAEFVAEKVCARCGLSDRCWKINFVKTYKMVENHIGSEN